MNGGASGAGVGPGIKSPTPYMSAAGGIRSGPGSHTGASSGITEAPVVISSGTNYQPASLGAQASTVLNRMKHAAPSSPKPFRTLAPSQEGTSLFPHLRSCLAHVSSGQSPQLVDQSYYLGHPALIVVLPGANGGRPHALVVAPGCTAITAHILATAPLPHSA